MNERYRNRIELLQGTLDLIILQTLLWGPQHGFGISRTIRANSGDLLQVDAGSLYPALHRLEKQKWNGADWKISGDKHEEKKSSSICRWPRWTVSAGAQPCVTRNQERGRSLEMWALSKR